MTYCDFKMVSVEISLCTYITYGNFGGGGPSTFQIFGNFSKMGAFQSMQFTGH